MGAQVFDRESSELSREWMLEAMASEGLDPTSRILHSDNGAPTAFFFSPIIKEERHMAKAHGGITGGVDTQKDTHTAAAIDENGRLLGVVEFRAVSN